MFRIGDTVRCIDADGCYTIARGGCYTVEESRRNGNCTTSIKLLETQADSFYIGARFELVRSAPETYSPSNLKTAKRYMVYNPNKNLPSKSYSCRGTAKDEAKRLAKKYVDSSFLLMESTELYRVESPEPTVTHL